MFLLSLPQPEGSLSPFFSPAGGIPLKCSPLRFGSMLTPSALPLATTAGKGSGERARGRGSTAPAHLEAWERSRDPP